MKPRITDTPPQEDLFRSRLENIISLRHPLVKLADSIDWAHLNEVPGEFHEEAVVGQPPKPTRLMAGLLYLKHTCGLSDDALLERWVESPYFQYFCGETFKPS